jgi:hypothetical protein
MTQGRTRRRDQDDGVGTVLYPSAHESPDPSSLKAGAGVRQQPGVIGTALYPSALSHQVSSTPIFHRRACRTPPPSCGGLLTCTDEKFEKKQESSGLTPGRATLKEQPPVAGGVRSEGTLQRTSWRTRAKAEQQTQRRFPERGVVSSPGAYQRSLVIRGNCGSTGKQDERQCTVITGSLDAHQRSLVIRGNCGSTRLHGESEQGRDASTLNCRGRIVIRFNRSMTGVLNRMFVSSHDMNCVSIHNAILCKLHIRTILA